MRVGGQIQQLEIGDDPRDLFEPAEQARFLIPDDIPDRLALAHIGDEKRQPEKHRHRRGEIKPQPAARHHETERQDGDHPVKAEAEKPAGNQRRQRQQRQQPESEKPAARIALRTDRRAGLRDARIPQHPEPQDQ